MICQPFYEAKFLASAMQSNETPLQVMSRIIKNNKVYDSYTSLYRHMTIPLVCVGMYRGLYFGLFDSVRGHMDTFIK